MVDTVKGKGFGIYAEQGKLHVNITSNYADDAIRLETDEKLTAGRWHHVVITETGSKVADGIQVYLDGKPLKVKVLLDTLYRPFRNAGAKYVQPFRIGGGGGPERRFVGRIDEVRVYARTLGTDEVAALAYGGPLESEKHLLRMYFLEHAAPAEMREAWAARQQLEREKEKLESTFPTVMIMAERPVRKDTFLLVRGAYDKPGDKVEPGVPAILPPLPQGAPNNRLGFAKWRVAPSNPLTARVALQRTGQMYFG